MSAAPPKVPTALEQRAALVEAGAAAAAPLLGPNAMIAVAALSNIANAIIASYQQGKDVTDAQIADLFDLDAAADRADALAQDRARIREADAQTTAAGAPPTTAAPAIKAKP